MGPQISLAGFASYLPKTVVDNDFFGGEDGLPTDGMFRGVKARHHIAADETAVDMIVKAVERLEAKRGTPVMDGVDIILTNVSLPDLPFTGCGAEVARALQVKPMWVYDVHSQGCVSFISMMALAKGLMATSPARRALICNVQTAAGRVFSDERVRQAPQAAVPGDGCGVAIIERGDACPIEALKVECFGDNASDMRIASPDGRDWWQPGKAQFTIDFSRRKVAAIVARGNRLVPSIVKDVCQDVGIRTTEIGALITNQPNPTFLRNWREALQVPEERHVHTFYEHGNLFGAAMPICLERANDDGKLEDGSVVVLGGFSHAGDYAAAAAIRWREAA